MSSFDVIILGGGPAGYVCALRCAQLGLQTAVIEREALGGTCVLWGCIPAKALLESANMATRLSHAGEHGIAIEGMTLDFNKAMKRSRSISTQNSKGVEFLFKRAKITWIRGEGTLEKGKKVSVTAADGKKETHDAKKAVVISTGSRVKGLPQAGLELDKSIVLSSDDVLIAETAPKSMAIVGAGAVGCEFADVFNAFGTKITLIDVAPTILPIEDADCSAELAKAFKKRKIDILTSAKITSVKVKKTGATVVVEAGGTTHTLDVDKVLVAAGRAPNVEKIGLETVGIAKSDRGFVNINAKFETNVPGYYAIGDVAGNQMLAHKGQREGHVLADMLGGQPTHPVNYGNVPSCTYCHPEVASVGLTEQACKDQKLDYKVGKFPFSANGRARTMGETDGFVKFIADAETDELLGCHMLGPNVSELLAEVVLAFEYRGSSEDIAITVHSHPTLSETTKEAALAVLGRSIHI